MKVTTPIILLVFTHLFSPQAILDWYKQFLETGFLNKLWCQKDVSRFSVNLYYMKTFQDVGQKL